MTIEYTVLTDDEYKEYKYLSILWLEEGGVVKTTPYTDNASGGYEHCCNIGNIGVRS